MAEVLIELAELAAVVVVAAELAAVVVAAVAAVVVELRLAEDIAAVAVLLYVCMLGKEKK